MASDAAAPSPAYPGSCHCGAVRFVVRFEPDETTHCDCTLCTMKNARMIRVPEAALEIVGGADMLATYRWNTGVAQHHFCRVCGIYTFHRKRADPASFGVNVHCLDGFDIDRYPHRIADGIGMSLVGNNP
jgi:hypothetical protein